MATIRTAHRTTCAESPLGEIQPVAHRTAHAVIVHPTYEFLVHTALVHQVLQQTAHRVVGECCYHGSIQTEAAFQRTRYVVFTAAFVDIEGTRGVHAAIAWIESQHDLAQS